MLVLSRYKDQSIYIGDDIVVTIVDVRGDRIRLGVEAPANVPVHRQEIYEQIQREKDFVRSPDSHVAPSRSERDDLDKEGFSEELRAVRSYYAGATAVVMGGWISEAAIRRLEKTLNFRLEWCNVGYSGEELRDYLHRPDVRLFIVQEPWCEGSGRFEHEVLASGRDFVPYCHNILTADKIAKAICERVKAVAPASAGRLDGRVNGGSRRLNRAPLRRDYHEGSYADQELRVTGEKSA